MSDNPSHEHSLMPNCIQRPRKVIVKRKELFRGRVIIGHGEWCGKTRELVTMRKRMEIEMMPAIALSDHLQKREQDEQGEDDVKLHFESKGPEGSRDLVPGVRGEGMDEKEVGDDAPFRGRILPVGDIERIAQFLRSCAQA